MPNVPELHAASASREGRGGSAEECGGGAAWTLSIGHFTNYILDKLSELNQIIG